MHGQRGVVTVLVALLLVAGVVFVLMQTTGVMRTRSMDTARATDSAAAFMLAESGLERAVSIVGSAASSGLTTHATCTGLLDDGPFALGRGTFDYTAAASSPASCGTSVTPCTGCAVTARGVVGDTQRLLTLNVEYGLSYGTTGRGSVVTMVLKNTFDQPAYALFNLGWRRQSAGGNASGTAGGCPGCTILWNLESSSGNPSVGGIGTAVTIAANTLSQVVTQNLLDSQGDPMSRDYTEVGGLFPGLSGLPALLAGYWSDNNSAPKTSANQQTSVTGGTNSGAAASDTANCLVGATVGNPPGNATNQTCNSWCYGGDTLVFGFSGRANTVADETTSPMTFNTTGSNGYAAQNVAMTRLVHFPNTDGSTAAATGRVYSEIWYAYNAAYSATSDPKNVSFAGAGATSYGAAIVGAAGALFSFSPSGKINNNSNSGTIESITGHKACVGDSITAANLPAGTTIATLNGSGAAGTCVTPANSDVALTVSANATGNVTSATVGSTQLQSTATTAALAAGAATVLASGATITIASGPDGSGVYTLSAPAAVASGYIVQGSGLSTTLKVASAADLPSAVGTRLQLYSKAANGTGAFAANTTVTAIDAANKSFTVSQAPTTALIGATLCGGTCALFNDPSSATSSTVFTITKSAGTTQWSGGFMCLSGVDPAKIIPVTSTTLKARNWSEAIQ